MHAGGGGVGSVCVGVLDAIGCGGVVVGVVSVVVVLVVVAVLALILVWVTTTIATTTTGCLSKTITFVNLGLDVLIAMLASFISMTTDMGTEIGVTGFFVERFSSILPPWAQQIIMPLEAPGFLAEAVMVFEFHDRSTPFIILRSIQDLDPVHCRARIDKRSMHD